MAMRRTRSLFIVLFPVLWSIPARAEARNEVCLIDVSSRSIPTSGTLSDDGRKALGDLVNKLSCSSGAFRYGWGAYDKCEIARIEWPPRKSGCESRQNEAESRKNEAICALTTYDFSMDRKPRIEKTCRKEVLELLLTHLTADGPLEVVDLSGDETSTLDPPESWRAWFTAKQGDVSRGWNVTRLEFGVPSQFVQAEASANLSDDGYTLQFQVCAQQLPERVGLKQELKSISIMENSRPSSGYGLGAFKSSKEQERECQTASEATPRPPNETERPFAFKAKLEIGGISFYVDGSVTDNVTGFVKRTEERKKREAEAKKIKDCQKEVMEIDSKAQPSTLAECQAIIDADKKRRSIYWIVGAFAGSGIVAIVFAGVALRLRQRRLDGMKFDPLRFEANKNVKLTKKGGNLGHLVVPQNWQDWLRERNALWVKINDQDFSKHRLGNGNAVSIDGTWRDALSEGSDVVRVTVGLTFPEGVGPPPDPVEIQCQVEDVSDEIDVDLSPERDVVANGIRFNVADKNELKWYQSPASPRDVIVSGVKMPPRTMFFPAQDSFEIEPTVEWSVGRARARAIITAPTVEISLLECKAEYKLNWRKVWEPRAISGCKESTDMLHVFSQIRRTQETFLNSLNMTCGGKEYSLPRTTTSDPFVLGKSIWMEFGGFCDGVSVKIRVNCEMVSDNYVVVDYGTCSSVVVLVKGLDCEELLLTDAKILNDKNSSKLVGLNEREDREGDKKERFLSSDVVFKDTPDQTAKFTHYLPTLPKGNPPWLQLPILREDRESIEKGEASASTGLKSEIGRPVAERAIRASLAALKQYAEGTVDRLPPLVVCTVPNGLAPSVKSRFREMVKESWSLAVASPIAEADAVAEWVASHTNFPATARLLVFDLGAGTLDVSVVNIIRAKDSRIVQCVARFGLPKGSRYVEETSFAKQIPLKSYFSRLDAEQMKKDWDGSANNETATKYIREVARFAQVMWKSANKASRYEGEKRYVLSGRGILLGKNALRRAVEQALQTEDPTLQQFLVDEGALKSCVALGAARAVSFGETVYQDHSWQTTKLSIDGKDYFPNHTGQIRLPQLGNNQVFVYPMCDENKEFGVEFNVAGQFIQWQDTHDSGPCWMVCDGNRKEVLSW